MQGVAGVRLMALNLGVTSEEELRVATEFWSSFFGTEFETGHVGPQVRLGEEGFNLFNLRIRGPQEAQFGHRAAFGLLVGDVEAFHRRALAAGATEHYAPVDSEGMPRHSLFQDPVGNRVTLWQG